jgi:hypothetical protein
LVLFIGKIIKYFKNDPRPPIEPNIPDLPVNPTLDIKLTNVSPISANVSGSPDSSDSVTPIDFKSPVNTAGLELHSVFED